MIAKLIEYFVRYPIWSNATIVFFVVFGMIGFFGLNMSFFPEASNRLANIEVAYPGASPQEMEEGVVLKVEESLKGVEGIEEITSVSQENFARVSVKWVEGYDGDVLLTDVKNAVDRINSFPVDAEKPVVYKQKDLGRAATVVMTGDIDLEKLKLLAEEVEDELLATGFISQVSLSGFPGREISIEISEDQLLRYGITFANVSDAVKKNNTNVTGGSIRSREEEILIRADAKGYTPEALGNIIVRTNPDGSQIFLRDLTDNITERFAETPNKTLFNGKPSITIQIQKLLEEDLVEITDYVKEYIEEWNGVHQQAQMVIINDQSKGLRERLDLLVSNGVVGLLLVLLALGFFLSFRLSFWVAWGIPFSFLGMFFVAYMVGITINMLSLFGMILAIGILVDDGIVVGENIYQHFEKGKSSVRAAIDGSLEVLPSVFTSVTTTIIVFSTFFFLTGRIGEFLREVAIVMVACLLFSLVECTLVLPAHLSHTRPTKKPGKVRVFFDRVINFLRTNIYGETLGFIMRYRIATVFIPVFFLLMTVGLFKGGFIQSTFFPFIEGDQVSVGLVMKPGTREMVVEDYLRNMNQAVWQLNTDLKDSTGVDSIITNTRISIGSALGVAGGHCGTLEVSLMEGEERPYSSDKIEAMLRERIPGIPEAEKLIVGGARIFGKPVSISLIGKNLEVLESANEMLQKKLQSYSALKDINDNKEVGKREVRIELKPKAYTLGLNHGEIARQIRQGFFGEEVQRLQKGTDEVRVWVRYPESGRINIGRLEEMRIKTANGQSYPFQEVASYEIERGIVSINHYDGAREIKVEADLADQSVAVTPLLAEIQADVIPDVLNSHPGVRVEYLGQAQRSAELFSNFPIVFGVAIFLMFLLLTLTFRSLPQALLLAPMIILGLIGALWGHGLHGKPVSLLSIYGLLAVSGIVINDAVVLMAKFNSNLKEGMDMKEAVFNAGLSRFRAILLTSITTVAGLYPLILAQSRQAQFLIPMAIAVVYGVLFGTLFILLFFPTLILLLNDFRVLIKRVWTGEPVSREEVEPAVKEEYRYKKYFSGNDPVLETEAPQNQSPF